MVPAIIVAERFARMKLVFNIAIVLMLLRAGGFRPVCRRAGRPGLLADAVLRRLQHPRSDAAVADFTDRATARQGAALGVYNTTQALGLFLGGVLGGVLAKYAGPGAVWAGGARWTLIWLMLWPDDGDAAAAQAVKKQAA
jgi:predicted MFS family arabinose efflux permease